MFDGLQNFQKYPTKAPLIPPSENPWGCHSQPRSEGYMVKDGIVIKGSIALQVMRYHKDTSTRECQYRISSPADPRCKGCTSP